MEHRYVDPGTLHRMLDKAYAEGVHIIGTAADPDRPGLLGARVSSARPGHIPYTVLLFGDEAGCDCPGYEKFGYCKHWALVLDRTGLLPEVEEEPEPEPPAPSVAAVPAPWELAPVVSIDTARVRGKRVRPAAA